MPLYIYRSLSRDKKPEHPTVLLSEYGNCLVKIKWSCTAIPLTGNQTPQKAVYHVTGTRGYLIPGHGTTQQVGYIHFARITLPKLTQPPKAHT